MTTLKPEAIPLALLARLLEQIAASYQQRGIASTDLSGHDLYRVFTTDEMFDVYADMPQTIAIGSLRDDIAELSKLLDNPERVATAVDIERMGNVLRAVSEAV
jgi:hypothetical protein